MNGTLAFLHNWTYITQSPEVHFDQLISHGPYAGTLQAFTTGMRLRTRYSHLLSLKKRIRFWASDCKRVIDSARYFASGMFGWNWETGNLADLEIIPETADRAADTLTPGDTCINYLDDPEHGHDKGINMLARFQEAYIPPISIRIMKDNPNIKFTNSEVYSMHEMCGFETMTRGSSPWCDVFTREDWDHFEYARDLLHYYRAGPGNPYAAAMGWLWLNKTAELLLQSSNTGNMFLSFVHDGDIAPMLAALEIFNDAEPLPTTHIAWNRKWKTSQVMPMGGRVIFERLRCRVEESKRTASSDDSTSSFLRININDGIVPLPGCRSGPGASCSLAEFGERVRFNEKHVKYKQLRQNIALCKVAGLVLRYLREPVAPRAGYFRQSYICKMPNRTGNPSSRQSTTGTDAPRANGHASNGQELGQGGGEHDNGDGTNNNSLLVGDLPDVTDPNTNVFDLAFSAALRQRRGQEAPAASSSNPNNHGEARPMQGSGIPTRTWPSQLQPTPVPALIPLPDLGPRTPAVDRILSNRIQQLSVAEAGANTGTVPTMPAMASTLPDPGMATTTTTHPTDPTGDDNTQPSR
ncbi:hypothetical protein LOZ12_004235 [Ophidiomyces ophidiicola]|uniref:uncharacterized protein n=1 Tax=Ophidiomyces ophidiicola TaxID=1387563 RepID=UPI0020C34DA5|nr:uncharacterized protein LOZ57_000526 [Ophidiomyces ophidiicola]KAI1944376.1 hypothetical protein LOZ62_004175 [Ophidiomyces ophidiicola]KAI1954176.1 hypothetical protein LOZ57_000526 [Ophidiomyces ophidiicola]KAI1960046.1 hypothetical protein LOZ59_002861 [Ophidiomyces ophidiicola]KAI1971077.1 hypothetical protein LOZ56_003274 [Ophidiomyces ophidiicola]KAI2026769.1 hypothetical protein LOZ45_002833 [Ophidiomyces ophidiicola]